MPCAHSHRQVRAKQQKKRPTPRLWTQGFISPSIDLLRGPNAFTPMSLPKAMRRSSVCAANARQASGKHHTWAHAHVCSSFFVVALHSTCRSRELRRPFEYGGWHLSRHCGCRSKTYPGRGKDVECRQVLARHRGLCLPPSLRVVLGIRRCLLTPMQPDRGVVAVQQWAGLGSVCMCVCVCLEMVVEI